MGILPRKIRVLFVIDSSDIGGAENVILSLMRSLPTDRFECYIACPFSGPMVEKYTRSAAGIATLSHKSFLSPLVILKIAALIRRLKVDIVHTCLYTSDVGGILAARIARAPRVVSHIVGHNFYVTEERGIHRLRKKMFSFIYRFVYIFSDKIVAVSEAVKADLVYRDGFRVSPKKIVVIRHSLFQDEAVTSSESIERARRLLSIRRDSAVIVTIANLIPIKGHKYLLHGMAKLAKSIPNLKCILVGDGPHRQALEKIVSNLGLNERVVFIPGVLDEGLKNAIIHLSKVVVLPSLSEGLPVVLLEAMALGKPVVATDVGGVREVVADGVTGFLVGPGDPDALAAAILKVVSNDKLADDMGRSGRRRIEEDFSWREVVSRIQELYLGLIR